MSASATNKALKFSAIAGWLLAVMLLLGPPSGAQVAPPVTQCVASAVATGTANAITIPALPCATTTNLVIITASAANTGAVTLQVIGQTAALPVTNQAGAALTSGQIPSAGFRAMFTPTGTSWIMLNPAGASGTVTQVRCGTGLTCTTP